MTDPRIQDLEARIAEMRRRIPPHSIPPRMLEALEEMEDELEALKSSVNDEDEGNDNP